MSALLYGVGAFALFAGLVMVGFGIPINEFSFGNTLISAGTTAVVGGLIIIRLGVVAGQLRRVAEALAAAAPAGLVQPIETFENAVARAAAPSRAVSVSAHDRDPSLTRLNRSAVSPAPAGMPFDAEAADSLAPTLRNPDQVTGGESRIEISLSPHQVRLRLRRRAADLRRLGRPSAAPAPGGGGVRHGGQNAAKPAGDRRRLRRAPARHQRDSFTASQLRRHVAGRGETAKGPVAGEPMAGRKAGCAVSRGIAAAPPKRTEPAKGRARSRS